MTGLNKKQQRFCEEYIIDLNATQAAKRAGYSDRTSGAQGHALLKHPKVAQVIEGMIVERAAKTRITAEWVLEQAKIVYERCMTPIPVMSGDIQKLDENGDPLFKIEHSGANKALEIIGRHVDIQAFKDNLEVTVNDDLPDKMERAMSRAVELRKSTDKSVTH